MLYLAPQTVIILFSSPFVTHWLIFARNSLTHKHPGLLFIAEESRDRGTLAVVMLFNGVQ